VNGGYIIVAARREGKWMQSKIVDPANAGAARVFRETLPVIGQEKSMQADLARFENAFRRISIAG